MTDEKGATLKDVLDESKELWALKIAADKLSAETYAARLEVERAERIAATECSRSIAAANAGINARHAEWKAAIDRNSAALERIADAIERRP
jgi:hypothetical protein